MNKETRSVRPDSSSHPMSDLLDTQALDLMVSKAREAQEAVAGLSDAKLDKVIHALVRKFAADCAGWARRELEVTSIGNAADKEHKLNLVLTRVFNGLHGTRTAGRIGDGQSVIEYASPMGVIFAVSPLTNPIPNSLFKTIMCVKTRNALIVSYPRAADALGGEAVEVIGRVLAEHGLPVNLVQRCAEPSRDKTNYLMRHRGVDMILATGGGDLVNAAYSSGTPAFGVGPGNVPVYVDRTADVTRAAADIVTGKTYDNGIVCGSESNVVVDEAVFDDLVAALDASGAAVLDGAECRRALDTLFDAGRGRLDRRFIGVSGARLAQAAGIERPYPIRLLVMPAERGRDDFLSREKMAPILTLYTARDGQGIAFTKRLLLSEGAGHTAVIHSRDPVEIDAYAAEMPAGRILVNTPATQGMLGETTDIGVSFMQGCGTWGRNSSTDPVTWRHFVNIKRLAFDRR